MVDDPLDDRPVCRRVRRDDLKDLTELCNFVLACHSAEARERDEVVVTNRILFGVELHVAEGRFLNERQKKVLLEVKQGSLLTLHDTTLRHGHARRRDVILYLIHRTIGRSGSLAYHILQRRALLERDSVQLAEVEGHDSFLRSAVSQEHSARTDLELVTTRYACGVHRHHWVGCEC